MNLIDRIPEHHLLMTMHAPDCPGCAYVRALWDVVEDLRGEAERYSHVPDSPIGTVLEATARRYERNLEAAGYKRPERSSDEGSSRTG